MNNEDDAFDLLTGGEVDSMQSDNQHNNQQNNNPHQERTNAFSFAGRTRRSSYWGIILFLVLVAVILGAICGSVARGAFSYGLEDGFHALGGIAVPMVVSSIILIICGWATQVRRCHDLGWSGWLVFVMVAVGCIPYIGWIVESIFMICLGVMDGQPFTNQYGPDPKGRNIGGGQFQQASVPQFHQPLDPQFQQPPTPHPQLSTTIPTSLGDRLRELKSLLDEGLLTQEEFDAQKAKLLNGP